jgi:NAD(P)-dependent dehydrogenase (short-subunit alcohol dehydrogenase family)
MNTIQELSSLLGRRAMVTGAAGFLGQVIADVLAELGAELILVDLPNSKLLEVKKKLESKWRVVPEVHFCDLEILDQRLNLISSFNQSHSVLDILVNNAALVGTSGLPGWNVELVNQSTESFSRALEVNVIAAFDLSKGFSSALGQTNNGVIINIASIYGTFAPDWNLYKGTNMGNAAAYGVSKAGLIHLTKWLASTLAPSIRVNSISPGGIFRDQPAEFVKRYEEKTLLARMATEDDIRGAVAYLATDMSKYVTGQNLFVDGGWGFH